ncbi:MULTISPECIES: DUF3060 domain-containing protein [Sphingobium]|uniref:DUF3060 domain-containing protein n=1 Tax=Sphingobium TaxID=165695 RepID=UPI0015EB411A|nr:MULTISPECIES: DUF3060 domain-containing protein [Sphingobium]MCW2363858.1 hypothetical protein [Sphingobium sp. B10D3B]MCW2402745.1 hypothetical protein [Sphingobium sp. B10D7B]MCW2409724.1 hypothetical protein [Sphingobium xanthum]
MHFAKFAFVTAILAIAAPTFAQATFEGAGEHGELDCGGGTATISGASNRMTVTGGCQQLVIEGAGNEVRVELASKGVIRIVGASNRVQWTTPDGSKAQLRVSGASNQVSMIR